MSWLGLDDGQTDDDFVCAMFSIKVRSSLGSADRACHARALSWRLFALHFRLKWIEPLHSANTFTCILYKTLPLSYSSLTSSSLHLLDASHPPRITDSF